MHRLFILLLITCLACNQQARDKGSTIDTLPTDGTELNDSVPLGPDTTIQPVDTPAPRGIYRVVLPGGSEHTLAFYGDHRYRLEERTGRKEPQRTEGEWVPTAGDLWLYRQGVVVAKYRRQGDTLLYQLRGKEYPMEKAMWAMDNDVWRNKGKEGLEFYGAGNEPFWNVEIDEQRAITFHLADWTHPARFPPARPLANGDSLQYNTANDSATLRVVVYHRFCSDGMSDFAYDQQVKVVYNSTVYKGCGLLFK